jgi:hypothetical protein
VPKVKTTQTDDSVQPKLCTHEYGTVRLGPEEIKGEVER